MQPQEKNLVPPLPAYQQLQQAPVFQNLYSTEEVHTSGEKRATSHMLVMLTRSPGDEVPITVPEYEVALLKDVWGEGAVQLIEGSDQRFAVDPDIEYQRLAMKYGINPDTKTPKVEEVYGRLTTGTFYQHFRPIDEVNATAQGEVFENYQTMGAGLTDEQIAAEKASRQRGMSREDVEAALAALGIEYNPMHSHGQLYSQLVPTFDQKRLREEIKAHGGNWTVTESNEQLRARLMGEA